MKLENRTPGTMVPAGEPGPLVFAPSHALPRNLNITTWLYASLSLFEGSPGIQALLMAAILLITGTAFECLKALIPGKPLAYSLGCPEAPSRHAF